MIKTLIDILKGTTLFLGTVTVWFFGLSIITIIINSLASL